jgi:hypothetical protein
LDKQKWDEKWAYWEEHGNHIRNISQSLNGIKLGTYSKHEHKVLVGRTLLGTCKKQNPKTQIVFQTLTPFKGKINALWYYWKALNEHKCTRVVS